MISIIRTRAHELETLSKAFLLRFFFKWICNEYNPDYGLDYKITIVRNGEETKDFFFVQLKATDHIDIKEEEINFVLDVKHILFFKEMPIPILLILYDVQNDCGYWLNIQRYYKDVLIHEEEDWSKQKTKTLKIPLDNKLVDLKDIEEMIIISSKELYRSITFGYEWFEGYEKLIESPEELDKIIAKYESDFIESNVYASLVNFRAGNMEKTRENLLSVYNQKKEDIRHLQIILSITLFDLPIIAINPSEFTRLLREGLGLAIRLEEKLFETMFRFYIIYSKLFELLLAKMPLTLQKIYIAEGKSVVDPFVQLIWDSEDLYLTGLLKNIYDTISQILKETIENGNIIEYIEMQLCVIFLDNFVSNLIRSSTKKVIEKDQKQVDFINQLLELIEKINNIDLSLQAYLIIGNFFEQIDLENCLSLYNRGLELAKQQEHRYYLDKFNENIREAGRAIEIPTLEEQREEIRNLPLKSFIELQEMKYKGLDSLEDEKLKKLLKFAQKQMYVLDILKYCEYLNICYFPSVYGQTYGIFSLGVKEIACLAKEKIYSSADLMSTIEQFKNNFCEKCDLRKAREENFDPPTKILDEMCENIAKMKRKNSPKV